MPIRLREIAAELGEGRKLLGLNDELSEFKVVFAEVPKSSDELAIRTRSISRMLGILSLAVEVPCCHLAEGRALDLGGQASPNVPAFVVHSSLERPCDSYATICYRGYWFWADDRDLHTKRYFQFMLAFPAQADTGTKDTLPLVTIRAN